MAKNHSFTTPTTATTGYTTGRKFAANSLQVITDEPGFTQYLYNNGTIEQPVRITLRSNSIKDVGGVKVVNKPANASGAVQYSIKVETVGRRVTPVVANATEDEAIAMWLNVKHGANDQWNSDDVSEIFRVLSGLLVKADKSTASEFQPADYKFVDLARGITKLS